MEPRFLVCDRRALHGAMSRNPDVGASMEAGARSNFSSSECAGSCIQDFISAFNACDGDGFEAFSKELSEAKNFHCSSTLVKRLRSLTKVQTSICHT